MIGGVIALASYYSTGSLGTGGTIGNILFQLEQQGVFAYLLPFLMIFAILYGILSKINIFRNNSIHVILSVVVALMSLQLNFVSYFFQELFPRMGILLSIIFVVLILVGSFWNFEKSKNLRFIMGALIAIGVIVIVYQSFGETFMFGSIGAGWQISYWLERNLGAVITGVLFFGGVAMVIKRNKPALSDVEKKAKNAQDLAEAKRLYKKMRNDFTQDY